MSSTVDLLRRRRRVVSFDLTRVSFLPVLVFRHNLRCRRLWVGLLRCRRLCRE